MITGDLDRALAALGGVAALGGAAGRWRPAGPGAYTTAVAFGAARRDGGGPATAAATLAAGLRRLDWVETAAVTGGGYLTVTITGGALGALAVRITRAGAACACGDALRGITIPAPREAGLAAAATWEQAHGWLRDHLTGRLAAAAGATVTWIDPPERLVPRPAAAHAGTGPVADAIAFAGADAVTWALCRMPPGRAAALDPRQAATHHPRNPAYAVRYAHAHAVSLLRQAADLGLDRGAEAGFEPRLLGHPSEQALLGTLSWLPERAGAAARRRRPDAFARYLEGLAGAYLACQEDRPAVWPGILGDATAGRGARQVTAARLWLAEAARTALAAGLELAGVAAPDRL